MSRHNRVSAPPSNMTDLNLRQWMWEVTDALNALPATRLISGNPNTSGVTADVGTIGINVASGATQRIWINQSGTTISWSWLSYIE